MLPKKTPGNDLDSPAGKTPARPKPRYCQFSQAADCLVRVLAQYGAVCAPAAVVARLEASASGQDVINFLDVAEHFGLFAHPIVLTAAEWGDIPDNSILHWGTDSLVVFLARHADSVTVYIPDQGDQTVGLAEFRRQFTGVVLVFTKPVK